MGYLAHVVEYASRGSRFVICAVYFGLRAEEGSSETSGVKRWNPTTKKLETIVSGVNVYGIALNNELSNLF